MKALLVTKCGCSRMMDIVNFDQDITLPFSELNAKNEFEKRRFKYNSKHIVSGIEIYIYKEV